MIVLIRTKIDALGNLLDRIEEGRDWLKKKANHPAIFIPFRVLEILKFLCEETDHG